jgi:hypothetical protein
MKVFGFTCPWYLSLHILLLQVPCIFLKETMRYLLKFDAFRAVTIKNAVFWDMITPCGSCKKRFFGGTYRLHIQGEMPWVPLVSSSDVPHGVRDESLFERYLLGFVYMFYRGDIIDKPLLLRMLPPLKHKCYLLADYGRLIITFDEATACQQYLHGKTYTQSNGDNVERGSHPLRREVHPCC